MNSTIFFQLIYSRNFTHAQTFSFAKHVIVLAIRMTGHVPIQLWRHLVYV